MKDPAVLFYTQDFITGTLLMTDEQRGKYIMLLCLQHQNGKLTERDMLKICGKKDADIWAKFCIEDGFYYNKRMVIESTKRQKHCEKQKENANKRWQCHGNATAMPLENENENEIIKEKKEELLKRKEENFKIEVITHAQQKYNSVMVDKFVSYWTEKNPSGNKMRYEFEKVFDIPRRLATWASRDKDIIKADTPKTYDEMLELTKNNPDLWKQYKSVKREGERKAIFYPINNNL